MDEKTLTELKELAQTLDNASTKIWQTIENLSSTNNAVSVAKELTFSTLKFELLQGAKLGDYEVAYKQNNLADKWQNAYNILRINNSTIKDRYHYDTYQYSYWLYSEDKIYRQKLKPKTTDGGKPT
jgi:hypothetical protein